MGGQFTVGNAIPDLFKCGRERDAKVCTYKEKLGGKIIWGPVFRINLTAQEDGQLPRYGRSLYCGRLNMFEDRQEIHNRLSYHGRQKSNILEKQEKTNGV